MTIAPAATAKRVAASMRAAAMLPFSSFADAGLAKIEKALPSDRLRDLRRLLACLYVGPLAREVDISGVQEMTPLFALITIPPGLVISEYVGVG